MQTKALEKEEMLALQGLCKLNSAPLLIFVATILSHVLFFITSPPS